MTRDEGGASLVEFAIVCVLFFGLVFGIIEFGLTLSHDIALKNGVREGARQGSVGNFTGGDPACSVGSAVDDLACFTKDNIGLKDVAVQVSIPSGAVGTNVLVCATTPMTSIIFLDGHYLHAKVTMRLEQATSAATSADTASSVGDHTPFSSWCHGDVGTPPTTTTTAPPTTTSTTTTTTVPPTTTTTRPPTTTTTTVPPTTTTTKPCHGSHC